MKKCLLCSKVNNIHYLKKVDGIQIYVCSSCQLGFLDKVGLAKQSRISKDTQYSLGEYRQEESKLKKRFILLSEIILRYKDKGKLLDVGAGFGLFASIFAEKRFNITAIEPVNQLYYLRKFKKKVYRNTFDIFFQKNKNKYDLILLIDIIEHLKNPVNSIVRLKNSLDKKGIIVIQTPNYNSLMAKICKNWSWWVITDHKYFFTPNSLSNMMKKTGYKLKFMKTYEDTVDFKKNLDGNFTLIENVILRRLFKAIYYVVFFPLYFLFRPIIWQLGYGGLIFMIFIRTSKHRLD